MLGKDYSNVISTTNLLNDSIIVINPTDHFCRGDICYAVLDGKALYFDDDHMSLDGAALIAENIIELIHINQIEDAEGARTHDPLIKS